MVCNGKTKQHRQIRCSGVPVFRCSGVFRCSRVFRCFGVFQCSGVPGFSTCRVQRLCNEGLRKDNIGLREVTSSGYSSEQPRSEIRLYRKLTCIHSLLVVMADDVGEIKLIKTSNVC